MGDGRGEEAVLLVLDAPVECVMVWLHSPPDFLSSIPECTLLANTAPTPNLPEADHPSAST